VNRKFEVPRYPTLKFRSKGALADEAAADVGVAPADAPVGNSYSARIEDVLLALQLTTKGKYLQAALLFKGTQENPKTYGVMVHWSNQYRKYEFYLLDPYGKVGRISLHKFPGEATFKHYFTGIAPAPVDRQEENCYWVMPLERRVDLDDDVDAGSDSESIAKLTATAAAFAKSSRGKSAFDVDSDDEDAPQLVIPSAARPKSPVLASPAARAAKAEVDTEELGGSMDSLPGLQHVPVINTAIGTPPPVGAKPSGKLPAKPAVKPASVAKSSAKPAAKPTSGAKSSAKPASAAKPSGKPPAKAPEVSDDEDDDRTF
jgi:hypothetical protein